MWRGWTVALCALTFSVSYSFVEYYFIRDTTLGYSPVLFSLIYPYHFAMAMIFGLAAFGLLRAHIGMRNLIPSLIMIGALFFSMLAVEDFTWFALRAVAPIQGDANAGKLVISGEWTTQFIGSTDAHFTAIPNWYFLSIILSAVAMTTARQGNGSWQPRAFTYLRRKSRRLASFPLSTSF
jgi:hypothetical protein